MKRYWLTGCFALLMSIGMAQEGDTPFLDGAARPEPRTATPTKPPALIAPYVEPLRITLPPTQRPFQGGVSDEPGTAHPKLDVGYSLDAPPDLLAQARWQRVEGVARDGEPARAGWVAYVQLHSPNAVGLRLQFQGRSHPDIQISIYLPGGEVVLTARAYPDEDDRWWAPTLWNSDTIGVEVFVPDGVDAQRVPEIVAIGYMYTGIEPDFAPAELGCHLDVTCYSDYNDTKRAVARIVFPVGARWGLCTGQLLNRTGTDFAPIFMTAQHCIGTQASAHGMEAYWFYETAACNGSPPNLNTVPRTTGALLLKQHFESDWTLLGLYEPPSGNYYLGWDPSGWGSGNSGSAVHHPGGTFKRVTFFTTDGTWGGCGRNSWSSQVSLGNGTIEGGSSGSAGLDSAFRVRGTCSCAETAGNDANGNPIWKCPTSGDPVRVGWGRMDLAFPNIRWYISGMANPTFVNRAVTGDANNEGDTERGTSGNPFNTVYEGTFCVPTGGTVRIVPGSYNERFRLWRAMRLERSGSSGVVRIGAP